MELISCTDYVLGQEKKGMQNTDRPLRFERIIKYAKFLKKPLTLSMFVPCDDEGNVLEEPKNYVTWLELHKSKGSTIGFTEHEQYQQAKERVVFEGFDGQYVESCYKVTNDDIYIFFYDSGHIILYKGCFDYKTETIEKLIQFNITITPNAVKTYQL